VPRCDAPYDGGVKACLGVLVHRLISIADEPSDDDDLRLRKRVGVATGYVIGIGGLLLPVMAQGLALSWVVALTMSPVSALNLAVLARTKRFDRYVVVLILAVTLFPAFVDLALGGMEGSSGGFIFSFVGPMFAILALGPRRATAWLILYLLVLLALILLDPIVSRAIAPQPYGLRLVFYASNFSAPLVIVFFLLRYTEIRRREAQALADDLLTNAIPVSIAARLKRGERIAEAYPNTTVLFADLVGFTPWAGRTDPGQVVSFLDDLFSRFDALAAACGVEKIKTIGDSYMAVAGAPEPRADHAEAAVALARGMLGVVAEVRDPAGLALEMRIGLASGSVVGGVIGQKRILFDLWGDTVNLASRMESSGVPGRIQVASSTWDLLHESPAFSFEAREPIEVKGLGRMTTYLLS
jgi:adenylate cyclase